MQNPGLLPSELAIKGVRNALNLWRICRRNFVDLIDFEDVIRDAKERFSALSHGIDDPDFRISKPVVAQIRSVPGRAFNRLKSFN